jgi:hypothetical protein
VVCGTITSVQVGPIGNVCQIVRLSAVIGASMPDPSARLAALSCWRTNVPRSFVGVVALSPLLLSACSPPDPDAAARPAAVIESVYTELAAQSCRKEADKTDPNETPYLVCPGVASYALIVRRVDAGRQSIDVRDPAQRESPLNFHEVVTRSMSTLDGKAEWRVTTKDGQQAPIALIVRVQAREDSEHPEKVTTSYVAVAKITTDETCVTDRIPAGGQSEAAVRSAADSARQKPCAPPQPPLTVGGTVIR